MRSMVSRCDVLCPVVTWCDAAAAGRVSSVGRAGRRRAAPADDPPLTAPAAADTLV
eukprot:gene55127-15063_t